MACGLLSSCDMGAHQLPHMWDLISQPGIKHMSPGIKPSEGSNPVLEGRFLITGLPEKSLDS